MIIQKSLVAAILSLSVLSFAAPAPQNSTFQSSGEIELSCRNKAKEIAAQAYGTCIEAQKSSQLEKIKRDYEAQLQALKADYESKLKKLKSSKPATSEEFAPSASSVSPVKKAKKAGKRIAKRAKSPATKKYTASEDSGDLSEMTVQLAPGGPNSQADESVMDLPEPIPVDEEFAGPAM